MINELLNQIVSYFRFQDEAARKFRVVFALSRVNKRLRAFALPISFRSLIVSGFVEFKSILAYFSNLGKPYASYVRSICFLPIANRYSDEFIPMFTFGKEGTLFPNLTTFEWCGCFKNTRGFSFDLNHIYLQHLSIPYRACLPFPDVTCFLHLDSLRLILASSRYPHYSNYGSSSRSYRSLTRLSILHFPHAQWPKSVWGTFDFPNLTVFNVQDIEPSSLLPVYDFIQRHSTLLEVNANFPDTSLRLEGLIKLIHGTGTWNTSRIDATQHGPPEPTDIAGPQDQAEFAEGFETRVPFPDDITDICVTLTRFGFVRESFTSDATEWRSSRGSEEARYHATSLALGIETLQILHSTGFDGFLSLSNHFQTLQELRIESEVSVPDDSDFVSYMTHVGSLLMQWKDLRKLAFGFTFNPDWRWGTTDLYLDPEVSPVFPSGLLDNVDPSCYGGPYSLNMVWEELLHTDAIEKKIRTILPDGETIDPDDTALIMRTWEIIHHHRVANVMSSLVENCPTLEEIEWAPMTHPRFFEARELRSLWKWKVHQGERGHDHRRRVSGTFSYTGCPSGEPSILHVLVGEELVWARERVRRCRTSYNDPAGHHL